MCHGNETKFCLPLLTFDNLMRYKILTEGKETPEMDIVYLARERGSL